MRPRWYISSSQSADTEELQADVMRFVAILGLCLAAIFSLVNAAHDEQAAPAERAVQEKQTVTESRQSPKAEQLLPAEKHALPEMPRESVPPPVASEPARVDETKSPEVSEPIEAAGFTLEFASPAALETLLRAGAIGVYAMADQDAWQFDAGFVSRKRPRPHSFYEMESGTLPATLRRAAQTLPQDLIWGVTLPRNIAQSIEAVMSGAKGGSLVIASDGEVSLE